MTEPGQEPMPSEPGGLPEEAPKAKTPWGKILAVVIVLMVIIAAVAVWRLGEGAQETQPAVQAVWFTSGVDGSVGSVGIAVGIQAAATGSIGTYEWDFGDGAAPTSTTTNATGHTYTTDGVYIILLTVRSPGGLTATNDARLLQATILDASFSPTNSSAQAVAAVNPTATTVAAGTVVANGSASHGFVDCPDACAADRSLVTAWSWAWDDGTAATATANTNHTFTGAGIYAVRLTVTVTGGATDSMIVTVRVAPTSVTLVKNPGTIVIASIGDPQYLDPAIDYETSGGEVIKNVYDRLVTRQVTATDPVNPTINNDVFVGAAASSWTYNTTTDVWNFTIRQGMRWQNPTYGNLTAYDVEYSLQRVLIINIGPAWILRQYLTNNTPDNPATPQNERWDAINASVVATDQWHVELRPLLRYGAVLQTLDFSVGSIVSKGWIEANGGTDFNTQNAYANRHMMGTGPFKLDHWTPGVEIKLVKNDAYWGNPKPRAAAVLYRQVPEPSTQELLLKNGDVDWADGIPTRDIRTVDTWDGIVVKANPSLVVQYMGMVEDNSWPGDPLRTVNTSPFQDVHVRRAVSYAFDYGTVLNDILDGWGTQLRSGLPQGMPGWDGSFWTYSFNITKARQEMALAAPQWAGGFNTTLGFNSGNPVRVAIGTMVQANLALLNINVTINPGGWPTYLSNLDFRKGVGLYIIGWAPDYLDPDDYLFPLFHSTSCPMPVAGDPLTSTATNNNGCYSNPAVDAALNQARTTTDWPTRASLYRTAQQHIVEDAAWTFLYQPTALDPIRDWVKGYYFDPMELRDFQYLYK